MRLAFQSQLHYACITLLKHQAIISLLSDLQANYQARPATLG